MNQVPDSLLAFQRMFPDDDACAAWLIEMRWPDGFVCPACGHDKGWALRGKVHTFECAGCRRQTSVTAGTSLHASKLALTVWFWGRLLDGDPFQRHLAGWYPQPSVIPQVDAVIHHGGNNSFTECLCFGKPALIMPYVWDGHDNATRVAETGHGLTLHRYDWSDEELLGAVDGMIGDARHARASGAVPAGRCRRARRPVVCGRAPRGGASEIALKLDAIASLRDTHRLGTPGPGRSSCQRFFKSCRASPEAAAWSEARSTSRVPWRPRAGVPSSQAKERRTGRRPPRRARATQRCPSRGATPCRRPGAMRRLARLIADEGVDLVHARSRWPAWLAYYAARRDRPTVRHDLSRQRIPPAGRGSAATTRS